MKDFKIAEPQSAEQASALLAESDGRAYLLAGGTDLLGTLKDKIHPDYPELVLNLKKIPGLDHVGEDEESLRVGQMLQFGVQGTLLELAIVLIFMLGVILFCIWSSRGPNPRIKVTRTRPRADTVDGFGGAKVFDHSYTDGTGRTIPVGFGTTPDYQNAFRSETRTFQAFFSLGVITLIIYLEK